MDYFYTTIEMQIRNDGGFGVLYQDFRKEDGETDEHCKNRAFAKLYTILQAAAVSEIPYHAGLLVRSDGLLLSESKVFDRRTAEE